MSSSATRHLLEVQDLHVSFETKHGRVQAVNGVNLYLDPGEVLVLIGESGSGKSVTALSIMGAASGGQISGHVYFNGQDLLSLSRDAIRRVRGNQITMIPQDPMVSFDPVYTVGDQIVEAILAHRSSSKAGAHERAVQLLDRVGIPKADLRARHFPHQFSGGMAQRALIAMALACDPQVLIADEPTTALDVTVQAQILELLLELQETMDLAVILITHDMGVAASVADRVAVMYAGRIVEHGDAEGLFYEPQHPYTWGLLQSTLYVNTTTGADLQVIEGRPPSLITLPAGCKFHPRCPYVMDVCREVYPEPAGKEPGHMAACHLSLAERDEHRPL